MPRTYHQLVNICRGKGGAGDAEEDKLGLLSKSRLRFLFGESHLNGTVVPVTYIIRLGKAYHYGLSISGNAYLVATYVWWLNAYIWLDTKFLEGPTSLSSSQGI